MQPTLVSSNQRPTAMQDELLVEDVVTLDPVVGELLAKNIDYIPNEDFASAKIGESELVREVLLAAQSAKAPADIPAHLQPMCKVELLSHEQESALFREMNLLKHHASELRAALGTSNPDMESVREIQTLLAAATQIRDHLVEANTRLAISVVKKFVSPQQSFDDMLSEGLFTLMQAVEKFDYDRGFRFSTYAYRSIARHAYRVAKTAVKAESRVTRDADEWAFGEDTTSSAASDQMWSNLRDLAGKLIHRLDRREQFIIRSRYALGAHKKAQTFQRLADKLGISKERARQLEKRAVEKLQVMAAEFDVDDLAGVLLAS